MSLYKKFVDSSAQSAGQLDQREHEQRMMTMMMRSQKSCAGARAPVVRMSPILSSISSTFSSTPIIGVARNSYKRMVPAEEFQCHQDAHDHHHRDYAHEPQPRPQQRQRQRQHHQRDIPNQERAATQIGRHQISPSDSLYQQSYPAQQRQQHQTHCHQLAASSYSLNQSHAPPPPPPPPGGASLNRSATPAGGCNGNSPRHRPRVLVSPLAGQPSRAPAPSPVDIGSVFRTNDPVLLEWLQAMRFDVELECLTALQARTLAIDDNLAGALSVRNSQVAIQEMRLESDYILDLTDILIDLLPINFNSIDKFALEFSNLWALLVRQTEAQSRTKQATYTTNCQKNLTIINCTPRKSLASARTLRPLDDLAVKIRAMCIEMANEINKHQEEYHSDEPIDNGQLEAVLRRIKELYGRFVEISIRAECANIVRALDFSSAREGPAAGLTIQPLGTSRLENVASSASLRPVRVYQSSAAQLPLKWALIALWQLTKDDGYICRLLTEMWQTGGASNGEPSRATKAPAGVAKRLDYSTKYEAPVAAPSQAAAPTEERPALGGQRCEKPSEICQRFRENQQALLRQQQQQQREKCSRSGALSSALRSKQPSKQLSTIELLIDIIISQPNKHERVDMMNFIQNAKLVDVEELDQSVSAAFYTSNQYKVAALRILSHLCINEQAIKTILKCFSTPPPKQGQPPPQNKIIKSIFECYQTAQEHIYQNETMFNVNRTPMGRRSRKRARQVLEVDCEEYSDYGSRQTNSIPGSESLAGENDDEGDDAVVREAIRLLIQLTTPFHRSNQGHDYYTLIGRFSIESLVKYLTNIIKSTTNRDMVLLSLSALANISFISTEPMKLFATSCAILDMFQASKVRSKDLELRDQTVTILANMADKNSFDIVGDGALTFLLSCLEICPTRMSNYRLVAEPADSRQCARVDSSETYSADSRRFNIENKPRDRKPIQMSDEFFDDLDCVCDNQQQTNMPGLCLARLRPVELAAMERIHQKTAVAFARLSTDPTATRMVQKYGGIKQMIDLCKLSHKRNHSDTVLIACLAALRKMAKVIGRDVFRHYNSLDLIELELNQALEIYGRLYASEV